MMKSLYSGVSGIKSHTQRMDVIGNNTANVNTTAYKASAVSFKDVFYQSKKFATGGSDITGSKNPMQIGYGSSVGTVSQVMTQSGFTYSDKVYDCALEGEGFFQVANAAGQIFYTRAGVFDADPNGNLVDPNGNIVLGVSGDPTGVQPSSQKIKLFVPPVEDSVAFATKQVGDYEVTLTAAGIGPEGNIAITLTNSPTPFSTLSGNSLRVQMDLEKEYATQEEFQNAVNAAIDAGGVNLSKDVLPLSIKFDSVPQDITAKVASNTLVINNPNSTVDDPQEPFRLKFTMNQAGQFGNAKEINVRSSETATGVTAKWSGDVLLVTLPTAVDVDGAALYPVDLEAVQKAVNIAAGIPVDENGDIIEDSGLGDKKKMMTLSLVGADGEEGGVDFADFPFNKALGKNTARVGLAGGENNFFCSVGEKLNSLNLTEGRVAANQNVSDLDTVFINDMGEIYGVHAVHGTFLMGRIDLVTFENPVGLEQAGTSYWQKSLASGDPIVKTAGQDGAGNVVSGGLEMSNVDLSQEFSDMIITQRGFQANSRIITVSDTLLEELINLKR